MNKAQEVLDLLSEVIVDEAKGKALGMVRFEDPEGQKGEGIKIFFYPTKEWGKVKGAAMNLKDPSEQEFESAVEDAINKGFDVINVYGEKANKYMPFIK